jgi:hypothetical protein
MQRCCVQEVRGEGRSQDGGEMEEAEKGGGVMGRGRGLRARGGEGGGDDFFIP